MSYWQVRVKRNIPPKKEETMEETCQKTRQAIYDIFYQRNIVDREVALSLLGTEITEHIEDCVECDEYLSARLNDEEIDDESGEYSAFQIKG
jgi:hypothetical protein